MLFFLFSSIFIYFSLCMSVLFVHIKDGLRAETISNHSCDEAF